MPTFAAQKISSSFHQLLETPQTPQVKSPWHFRIVEVGNPCLSFSVQASSLKFRRNYNQFSPWEMCHLHGRKGYLWAEKAPGRKGISEVSTCPSASSPQVATDTGELQSTPQTVTDADVLQQCQEWQTPSEPCLICWCEPGSRTRRNNKHIPQIQRAAMPLLLCCCTGRIRSLKQISPATAIKSQAHLNAWMV